jgi:hypothetical protein
LIIGFDPIGFSDYIDVRFLREAELKHARIAMLSFLGFVGTEFVKLPDHNYSPVAAHDIAVSSGAMAQILTFVAALEFISVVAVKQMLAGSGRAPGDYGFDPLSFSAKGSQKDKETMALKELGWLLLLLLLILLLLSITSINITSITDNNTKNNTNNNRKWKVGNGCNCRCTYTKCYYRWFLPIHQLSFVF